MASTTIFLWRAKLCHSYLLGGSRSAPGGSPETEPAAQVVQECADGGYSHERHIGSEYERHGRRVEDYGGRQQPVGPDGAGYCHQVSADQEAQYDVHEVLAPGKAALAATAGGFFEDVGPGDDDVSGIDKRQHYECRAVKPEVGDDYELGGIYSMPDRMPEDFSLTFGAGAEIAFVVMEINNVKYAEVAGYQ